MANTTPAIHQTGGNIQSAVPTVVDGEVISWVAGRQEYGIESERHTHQHAGDVEAGGDEGPATFGFGIRPEHRRQAGENNSRDQNSEFMRLVVRHDFGLDKVSRNQGIAGQKKLQRPTEQSKTTARDG